ncbi:MAG: hypothetical protein GY816_11385 [Cytophagales bacterium]|nr:hypothetical protein [Cytophagales bacterium]
MKGIRNFTTTLSHTILYLANSETDALIGHLKLMPSLGSSLIDEEFKSINGAAEHPMSLISEVAEFHSESDRDGAPYIVETLGGNQGRFLVRCHLK